MMVHNHLVPWFTMVIFETFGWFNWWLLRGLHWRWFWFWGSACAFKSASACTRTQQGRGWAHHVITWQHKEKNQHFQQDSTGNLHRFKCCKRVMHSAILLQPCPVDHLKWLGFNGRVFGDILLVGVSNDVRWSWMVVSNLYPCIYRESERDGWIVAD